MAEKYYSLSDLRSIAQTEQTDGKCSGPPLDIVSMDDVKKLVSVTETWITTNLAKTAYAAGEWDMFVLISSAWHGKQYYFLEDGDRVYSRQSCKYMTRDEAIQEFLDAIERTHDI